MISTYNSPIERAVHHIRSIILGNGTSKLFLLVFELLLARLLGAEGFGLYTISISLLIILSSLCLFGTQFALVQFISIAAENKKKPSYIFALILTTTVFVSIIATTVGGLVWFFKDKIAADIFHKPELTPLLPFIALLIPIESFNQCLAASFRGLRHFYHNIICLDFARNITVFVALPFALIYDAPLTIILQFYTIGSLLGSFYAIFILWRKKIFSLQHLITERKTLLKQMPFQELITFAKPLFLWSVFQTLSTRILLVVSGVLLTTAQTGVLGVINKLALFMIFFQTAVNSTVQTEFARLYNKHDTKTINKIYQSLTRGLLGVTGGIALILMINQYAVLSIFGHSYTAYGWAILPLLVAHFSNVVTGPAGQVFISCHKQTTLLKLTIFSSCVQFFFVIPAMFMFGIQGAVYAEAVQIILLVSIRLFVLNHSLRIHPFTKTYGLIMLLWVFSLLLGKLSNTYPLPMQPYTAVAIGCIFYTLGGILLIVYNKDIQSEAFALIKRYKKT